jgi:glutaredoxin-like protein NrdH
MVTIYTKDACVMCDATKKYLTRYNIPFDTKHVSDLTPEQIADHRQAPVVIPTNGPSWSGFDPDRLKTLRV